MTKTIQYTSKHHAILFGFIAKSVIDTMGEDGREIIRNAAHKYGNQRGKRMALRVLSDELPLTMENYFVYSEWNTQDGDAKSYVKDLTPEYIFCVEVCSWCENWKEFNLSEYGKYYCSEIDIALLEGYNPKLTLEVPKILSLGDKQCQFHWKDAHFTKQDLENINQMKQRSEGSHVASWEFHTAHLYFTMKQEICTHLKEKAQIIMETAEKLFKDAFGQNSINQLMTYELVNFSTLDFFK
ncbi:hypothetical protein NEF87_000390 [Candidatus Lokiarchaeum ossiferum]|uniref:L-2-amino-thiazoline-4-carboxylic acid hydrolase n=1 Tax=Candidatus Lokiarchaeum ossiferum TaxID=2951803 RepID=A0ABY6HL39_9ARCH|nr:hypothetical protein NEF87_000390 [Candidatus Lokiarchaeum sp. B-35]